MVTGLLLVMSLQTLATLPVVTALSMGYRQCALKNIGEMQDYLASVLGMTGPGRHRAKGRKHVRLEIYLVHFIGSYPWEEITQALGGKLQYLFGKKSKTKLHGDVCGK